MTLALTGIRHLLACATLVCIPASANPAHINDKLLDALLRANQVPGMSAAIIKDGKLVWQGNAGFADVKNKVPVSADTRFRLASVSKFATTMLLARLVEQGRLDLSAPISQYLPDFPKKTHPMTSMQLAAHIAGMPHYDPLLDANRDEVVAPFATVSAGLAVFQHRPQVHPPGSAYLYSSFGFNLLAAVMERTAQLDFQTQLAALSVYAKAPSLRPETLDADRTHWSALYEVGGKELPRGNITYNLAGGGLLSTATDLARVGAATLDPAYIAPRTLKLFTTPVRRADGSEVNADGATMGIGWRLNSDQHGRRFFHHSGVTRGARAHLSVYPDQRLVIAILSNASWISAIELTARSLAEPFLDSPGERRCTARSYLYRVKYKEQTIDGAVRFEPIGRHCEAVLMAQNALGTWLANGHKTSGFPLYGQGNRMALVTPLGLFPVALDRSSMSMTISGAPVVLALTEQQPN